MTTFPAIFNYFISLKYEIHNPSTPYMRDTLYIHTIHIPITMMKKIGRLNYRSPIKKLKWYHS